MSRAGFILGMMLLAWTGSTTEVAAQRNPPARPVAIPDSVTPERVLAGSEIFNNGSCIACHAVAGVGSGRFAPSLADVEWLHSDGDYDGILHTIFWGVKKEEFKAVTPRRFEMHPSGGMPLTREQQKAVAAYVWTISRPQTNVRVAAQQEFLRLARAGQVKEAVALFEKERKATPDHLLLPENGLNRFGYAILPRDAVEAVVLFELNGRLHPDSWNVYDSLGEAYAAAGRREDAIRAYRHSLQLNPENQNAVEKLKHLGERPGGRRWGVPGASAGTRPTQDGTEQSGRAPWVCST